MRKKILAVLLVLGLPMMTVAQNHYRPENISTKHETVQKKQRDGRDYLNLSVGYANWGGYNDYGQSSFPLNINIGWHRYASQNENDWTLMWEPLNFNASGDFGNFTKHSEKLEGTIILNAYTGAKVFYGHSNWKPFAELQLGLSWTNGLGALDKMKEKPVYNCGGWNIGAGVGIMYDGLGTPVYLSINDRYESFHLAKVNVFSINVGVMFQIK